MVKFLKTASGVLINVAKINAISPDTRNGNAWIMTDDSEPDGYNSGHPIALVEYSLDIHIHNNVAIIDPESLVDDWLNWKDNE